MIVHQFVMSHVTVVFLDSKLNGKVHSDVLAFFIIIMRKSPQCRNDKVNDVKDNKLYYI